VVLLDSDNQTDMIVEVYPDMVADMTVEVLVEMTVVRILADTDYHIGNSSAAVELPAVHIPAVVRKLADYISAVSDFDYFADIQADLPVAVHIWAAVRIQAAEEHIAADMDSY